MKRFYETAAAEPAADAYAVTLDGRPIRTPGGTPLRVPHHAVAAAIAAEWQAQGEKIEPKSMPLMALAATAIDRVAPNRDAVIGQVAAYAATDLLCYRAATPSELAARQAQVWQPLLDWLHAEHNAPLTVTTGITPITQRPETLAALTAAVAAHDDLALAALSSATASSGSLVIGLALSARHITAEEAFAASQLDETYQAEVWGADAEADKARAVLGNDLTAAGELFKLLTQSANNTR